MALHGVFYDIRPLSRDTWGIVVKTWINGAWIETDQNTTPWPSAEIAVDRAARAAECKAEREGLPVSRVYRRNKAW